MSIEPKSLLQMTRWQGSQARRPITNGNSPPLQTSCRDDDMVVEVLVQNRRDSHLPCTLNQMDDLRDSRHEARSPVIGAMRPPKTFPRAGSDRATRTHLYLTLIVMLTMVLHDFCLCNSLLANTDKVKAFNDLVNNRIVRSYSEEFMSSSEERERGLQFFGGASAGSVSSRHRIVPYFDTEGLSTNVTISEGSALVHLPCRVKQLGDRTLSWIRRKDLQILTVGKFTYTSDLRFSCVHFEQSDDWSLQISYPQKKDAGTYECQVATMPKMSQFVQLNVVVSKAKILEGPTLYLSSGSTLNLTCVVRDTPEPPDFIFWHHNGMVINYGSSRGIKVHTEKSRQTISKLTIFNSQPNNSGNYTCLPSTAEPAHIAVHIQNQNPAASIQHGKRSAREFGTSGAPGSILVSRLVPLVLATPWLVAITMHTINFYY